MFINTDFPPPTGRLAQFMRLVEAFERDEIEAGVDLLIEALDARDGDTDREPNGDELDASYPEAPPARRAVISGRASLLEDAEDDDDDEGAEDRPHDAEEDFSAEERGEVTAWPERIEQPDCMIGGVGGEWEEDAEPWHVPASMDRTEAANDRRIAA